MSSDFPEWSRREAAARQAGADRLERVRSKQPLLQALFAEFGVREAFLFGSVARGDARADSDVDIAVAGCPPEVFYRLGSRLERALGSTLDVVDLDMAPADFAEPIRTLGLRLYPPSNGAVEGDDQG